MLAQVVEAKPVEARGVPQRAPGRVPLQHRLCRVVSPPLSGGPEVMAGPRVPEQVGAFEHACDLSDGRTIERDDAMARLASN
jgi:hypothetical protein